jgi:hypothetical protein
MAFKNTACTVIIGVWDATNNAWKTGDAANLTIRGVGDGTEYTPATPGTAEIDATNAPGCYKVALAAGENNYTNNWVGGKSSTAGCVVIPAAWTNEVNANLAAILLTALTETAGYLAAGFKKFFNIQTPVMTVAGVDQTGDSYGVVKASGTGDNAAIKAKTDNLPASPAAVGSNMG